MLDFTVDSLDAVPEKSKKFYTEVDGKFLLDEDLVENIKGLKSALDRKTEMANENAKKAKEIENKYSSIDVDKYKKMQELIETNEEARLISENKFEEAFQKRSEKWRADEDRQKKDLQEKIDASQSKIEASKAKVLESAIVAAAMKKKLTRQGLRDSMLHAKNEFQVDDDWNIVKRNPDGSVILGVDGKTQFGLEEWYDGHFVESPGWFEVNSSGSPATGKPSSTAGKNMKRSAFDTLSPMAKADAIKGGVTVVD